MIGICQEAFTDPCISKMRQTIGLSMEQRLSEILGTFYFDLINQFEFSKIC